MYFYFNVCSDEQYSNTASTTKLRKYLQTLSELKQTGPVSFSNADTFPWLDLSLLQCDANGNHSSDDNQISFFNLIELIGTQSENYTVYFTLAEHIASFLEWRVIDVSHYR